MQHKTKKAGVLLLAMLVLAGCGKQEAPPQQPTGPHAIEVGVVEVAAREVTMTVELPGRTHPYLVAEVRPQVSGIVLQRHFKEGSDVKRNDVLYQIDSATYRATLNSAAANLSRAEANLASSRSRAERYAELVKINAVSKQDYDDVNAAFKQAVADVEGATAAVESARINLDYTTVMAPISGRIGKSEVTQGALVTAGQPTALARIQQLDPIFVDVTQSSVEWLRMRREIDSGILRTNGKNQARVKLKLEDGRMYPHEGRLEFSDVTVDQATGMITLRAVFPNPRYDLLPGMYVRAVLEEGVKEQAITVPQSGVTRDPRGRPLVVLVTPENTIERRLIEVEKEIGNDWLVTSGLQVGEKIIVEGVQRLMMAPPGAPIKPVLVGQTQMPTQVPTPTQAQAPTQPQAAPASATEE